MSSGSRGKGMRAAAGCLMGMLAAAALGGCTGLQLADKIARDSAAVRRAKWEKAEAERSAALRIEKAVEEVASAAEILAARDEAASAAKANLDLAKAAEKAGTAAMLDVQEAQAELAEANLQRFIALHACVAARYVFELETGAPVLTE